MIRDNRIPSREILVLAVFLFFALSGIASADTLGQQQFFFVNSKYDALGRSSLTATLKSVGDHAYIYVDDSAIPKDQVRQAAFDADVQALAETFDSSIYPIETQFWGPEPNPGIDNDPKITILLERLAEGNGGYFETSNGYSRKVLDRSNEREMIMLDVQSLSDPYLTSFLAHEFQHLISFNQKEVLRGVSETIWLNEVRAEYSVTRTGLNIPFDRSALERRTVTFLRSPSDSLTRWANTPVDYGIATLFGHYLVEQYGPEILTETLRSDAVGIASLNAFLRERGHVERFSDVFLDWAVAVSQNDASRDPRYGYKMNGLENFSVVPMQRAMVPTSGISAVSVRVADWQPLWHEFLLPPANDVERALKLDIGGVQGRPFPAALVLRYDDGTFDVQRFSSLRAPETLYAVPTGNGSKVLQGVLVIITYGPDDDVNVSGDTPYGLFLSASLVDRLQVPAAALARALVAASDKLRDGALIKRSNGESDLYIIRGAYKRWVSPDIAALYGLDVAKVIPVGDTPFHQYTTSNYVRAAGQPRVYAIWPDGTKHWLRMSARTFSESGRDWDAIFTVSPEELDRYRTGSDITR